MSTLLYVLGSVRGVISTFGGTVVVLFLMASLANPLPFWEFFHNAPLFGFFLSVKLLFSLVLGSFTDSVSLVLAVVLAFLISLNLLLLRRIKTGKKLRNQHMSLLGAVSGIVGIGCAACGTLLSGVLVSVFGLSFATATLPFQSMFFQVTGIVFLLMGIILLIREAPAPLTCPVPS